ncbi:hypothetical protein M8997_006575 [Phyllobacterium sp. 21LDTY02-6]|uniref:hypothetical protein n=1 Tax=unclassified Phyllobacterium TaxID=2638441 RepID=UPI0020223E98|nr:MULTISPECIES: hypothetical protein [unclassified Phyllobacterium]MCO4316841.1 hypothetical protein [Phyllobacterium sp. 21LDTY02-6]MCX8281877.1 hypothetical protein [Phyllobacterium sp. 0TCS1.6C]MCX8295412.1 hypothetical protein [Phyllobacterium sp. 0TCS1.6A]
MAAKPVNMPPSAKLVRKQITRAEFRNVAETARPSQSDRNIPDMLRDLLKRLDEAEVRHSSRRRLRRS